MAQKPPVEVDPELARLPKGRHGLSREFIERNHRQRLAVALAEVLAEQGYASVSIAEITKRAAVSRRVFYEHFANVEAAFLAAHRSVIDQLSARMESGLEAHPGDWAAGMASGLASNLRFFAADPDLARLALVESQAAGRSVVPVDDSALAVLTAFYASGRSAVPDAAALPENSDEAIAGGVLSLVSRRLIAGEGEQLSELLPDLIEFSLAPYIGARTASRLARSTAE
jgi:AcrR family transcriptional regulator